MCNNVNNVCIFFRTLSQSNSGSSSVELQSISKATPLKVVEKDEATGEYIVCISPQEFDMLSNGADMSEMSR